MSNTISKNIIYEKLAGELELQKVLKTVGNLLMKETGCEGYVFYINNKAQKKLTLDTINLKKIYKPLEKSIIGYQVADTPDNPDFIALKKKTQITITNDNTEGYNDHIRSVFKAWRIESMLVTPIFFKNQRIGTVQTICHKKHCISETSKEKTQELINKVSPFIFSSWQYTLIKRFEDETKSLGKNQHEIIKLISKVSTINNLEKLYEILLSGITNHYDFDFASIHRLENMYLVPKYWYLAKGEYEEDIRRMSEWSKTNPCVPVATDSILSSSFANNTLLYVPNIKEVENLPMTEHDRVALSYIKTLKTTMFLPIRHSERTIGVIWMGAISKNVILKENDKMVLEAIAAYLGTAIENATMYEQIEQQKTRIESLNKSLQQKVDKLHKLATHDNLTGLYNLGHFKKILEGHIAPNDRRKMINPETCVVMVDIDHFKNFNDSYGHESGNKALVHMASLLKEHARDEDSVCRYGGEEFTIVLPKCDLKGAIMFAERVREQLESTPIFIDGQDVFITASFGCAVCNDGDTSNTCIANADKELYNAKENGRNRVYPIID